MGKRRTTSAETRAIIGANTRAFWASPAGQARREALAAKHRAARPIAAEPRSYQPKGWAMRRAPAPYIPRSAQAIEEDRLAMAKYAAYPWHKLDSGDIAAGNSGLRHKSSAGSGSAIQAVPSAIRL
jgi:hypothetical protein